MVLQLFVNLLVADRGCRTLLFGFGGGHIFGSFVKLLLEPDETSHGGSCHVPQGQDWPEVGLLTQQADLCAGTHVKVSVVRLILTIEHLQKSGFTDTVGADQTHPLAGPKVEIETLKNRVARDMSSQVLGGK